MVLEVKSVDDAVDDDHILKNADDIAAKITKMLVEAFVAKEGRTPTSEEVEDLIGEITEERIQELLNEQPPSSGEDNEAVDQEKPEEEDDDIQQDVKEREIKSGNNGENTVLEIDGDDQAAVEAPADPTIGSDRKRRKISIE
jgi:hypothetical protein